MDLREDESALRRMRFGLLEPKVQRELLELASELGYEGAITAQSDLHFLARLYQEQKAREEAGRAALDRAADMILRLSSMHYAVVQREQHRRRDERRRKIPLTIMEGGISVGEKSRRLLASIGVEDEGTVARAVGLFGDAGVEERVGYVKAVNVDIEIMKGVFRAHPETILFPKEEDFLSELDAIEHKKGIIDEWAQGKGRAPPEWADYRRTPGILLDTYEDIARQLEIVLPAEKPVRELKPVKFVSKPMHPDDFMKVVQALGFERVRDATHGTLMRDGAGNMMCVAKSHRKQAELNGGTIKKKLVEAGVDLERFEKQRREMRL